MRANLKYEAMRELESEVSSCGLCGLCRGRRKPVVGEGSLDSKLMLIGEAPGRKEDETGRPFVGSAGKLLDGLLDQIGMNRNEVYIGNIVKCRPPGNRRPTKKEIEACSPYIERQCEIIQPRVIVPMGNSATSYFMKRYKLELTSIGVSHGKEFGVEAPWGSVTIFPLYHPASILYDKSLKETVEKDFEILEGICGG